MTVRKRVSLLSAPPFPRPRLWEALCEGSCWGWHRATVAVLWLSLTGSCWGGLCDCGQNWAPIWEGAGSLPEPWVPLPSWDPPSSLGGRWEATGAALASEAAHTAPDPQPCPRLAPVRWRQHLYLS